VPITITIVSLVYAHGEVYGLVVNLYIPHNRRMPFQAEEALGPISIPQGQCLEGYGYGL
jgi:hypothetical protein